MNKNQSLGIWLVIGILVLALASMLFAGPTTSTKDLTYTEFLSKVRSAEIKEVVIENDTVTAVPIEDEINKCRRKRGGYCIFKIQGNRSAK